MEQNSQFIPNSFNKENEVILEEQRKALVNRIHFNAERFDDKGRGEGKWTGSEFTSAVSQKGEHYDC